MGNNKRIHRCGPRVRTGCQTCRVRRIKCDEARPTCRKCTTSGRRCDGYAHLIHELSAHMSKIESWGQATSIDRVKYYEIPFAIPGSQRDRQLFNYYCTTGAKDLAGYLDTTLWYDVVLTHSRYAPFVRQAVIAFSAAQLRLVQGQDHILLDGAVEHLKQYDKAVRWLRKYLSTTNQLRTEGVLVACALLFATCIAKGEIDEAFQHIDSGLLILRTADRTSKQRSTPVSSLDDRSLPKTSSMSSDGEDLDARQDVLRKFFVHVEKELGVHGMVRGQPEPPNPISALAARRFHQCQDSVREALSLSKTRLTALLRVSATQATADESQPYSSDRVSDSRISKPLQLVKKWSDIVSCMTDITYDVEDGEKVKQRFEMVQNSQKRLSLLSLDIWLAVLRSSFPQLTHVWTMCPNPLAEAFILLRERTIECVLSWISVVSGKAVKDHVLCTSVELFVVVPLILLAEDSVSRDFSNTIHEMLRAMLAHSLYEKVKVFVHQLTTLPHAFPKAM